MNLAFVQPAMEHLDDIKAFRQEFLDANEVLHGGSNLSIAKDLPIWVINVERNRFKSSIEKGWAPSTVSLVYRLDDDKLIGILDMRHELNDKLLEQGGHIGYSVRKSEREKGYGTKMLQMAIEGAKDAGFEKLLITCDADNIASKKIIQHTNAVLENVVQTEDGPIERYWVTIE